MALKTLYQMLLGNDRSQLRVIARQWDIPLQASSMPDLAAEVVNGMASEEAVNRCLEQLPPEQRDALDDLLRRGGSAPWAIFVRRWGTVRTIGAGRLERDELWREPQSAAEALWFLGLVQRAFTEDTDHPIEMAFIPEELMLYMPPPAPVSVPAPPTVAAPPLVIVEAGALADDLVTVWATVQQGETPMTALAATLQPPAELRCALLETLSVEQGWLRARTHHLNADAVLGWLRSAPWEQASSLFEAWRSSREWHDVAHIPSLSPDPVKGWPTSPRESRQAFLETLKQCTVGKWYNIKAFIDYVRTYAADFLRPDGDYETWAPRSTVTRAPLRGFEAWNDVEGELVRSLIAGPLVWLGAVTLGGHELEAPEAFTLTEAAAAWLGTGAPPEPVSSPPITVAHDGRIAVPTCRRYERFQLSRIADLTEGPVAADEAARSGNAGTYVYRLSTSSLHRAKQQRISVERIIAFLEEASGENELSQQLKIAIQHGYEQEGGASLAQVWLLTVTAPRHLQISGLSDLITARLTPQCAIIAEDDRERVIALLAEHGVLVEFENG